MSGIYSAQARYVLYYITLIGLSCGIKYNENIRCNKATFFHKHLCGFWTLLKTVKVGGNFCLQKVQNRVAFIFTMFFAFSTCHNEKLFMSKRCFHCNIPNCFTRALKNCNFLAKFTIFRFFSRSASMLNCDIDNSSLHGFS